MRILITGGSSYLGRHLVPLAREAGHQVHYTYHSTDPLAAPGGIQLDIRQRNIVQDVVQRLNPEAIIHLAGSNRSPAMTAVIEEGGRWISEAAASNNSRLIFMSTDVIFDGCNPPYKEGDPPTPPHPYGAAKANAEKIVAAWPNHVIVRPSLIYGLGIMDLGTAWMVDALRAGEPVTLFTDQMRAPIWADALAAACLELTGHTFTGILHVAGPQPLSRADFGQKMLAWWQVAERDNLKQAPTPVGSPWPLNTVLDISRAQTVLTTKLPGVDTVINSQKSTPKRAKLSRN